jgi:hypothetical protein
VLGAGGLGSLGGGSAGGGSSSGTTGSSGTGTNLGTGGGTQVDKAKARKYLKCLEKGTSQAQLTACSKLLK